MYTQLWHDSEASTAVTEPGLHHVVYTQASPRFRQVYFLFNMKSLFDFHFLAISIDKQQSADLICQAHAYSSDTSSSPPLDL